MAARSFICHAMLSHDNTIFRKALNIYYSGPVALRLILKLIVQPFICFRVAILHSTSYLFFLYRSPFNQDCSEIDAFSNRYVLSNHPGERSDPRNYRSISLLTIVYYLL